MTTSLRASWMLLVLALVSLFPGNRALRAAAAAQDAGAANAPRQVLVVTLRGRLGTPELARCIRALRDAEQQGAAYVVFRIDLDAGSQSENPGDLQSLFDHVQKTPVATVTLVRGRATQGAAYLALVTDKAYCAPGSQFGELTKPEQEWDELLSASPDQAMHARLSAAREALESRLDRRRSKLGPDARRMALAMVDPRMQLVQATLREGGIERRVVLEAAELAARQAGGAVVLGPEKLSRPLMVDARTAEEVGLTQGTVQDLDQLCTDVLGCARGGWAEVGDSWAEHAVAWLEMVQPFLLVAGLLLILFEVKTPGVGLPGLLGTGFLALAMFHSYLVGLADAAEIVVFFLGLAALAVEIFVLPGTVVFGVVGFLCLVLALVLSRQSFVWPSNALEEDQLLANLLGLTAQFLAVAVLGALLWRFLPRLPWFNRVLLKGPDAAPAAGRGSSTSGLGLQGATALVGRVGRAVTVLRPTGAMELDGERYDVVTEGEFVEPGTVVRVLYVQGVRIVVGREGPDARAGERGNVGVVLLLAVLGLALIVAEVFFVSFGAIAALAGLALIGAVFLAFQDSTAFGVTMLVGEAIAAPLVLAAAFKLLPRTRLGKELILDGPATPGSAGAADESLAALLHQTGVSLSPLRPAGFARLAGRKVDVVTRGEMLDAGVPVEVVEVTGNRVVVAQK